LEKSSIYKKIKSRRTVRKYLQKAVPEEVLLKCVDAARLSPSGANMQPLSYVIVNDQKLLKPVFSTLSLAGYLPDYLPKEEGCQKPTLLCWSTIKLPEPPITTRA
jgi:nitroreductase